MKIIFLANFKVNAPLKRFESFLMMSWSRSWVKSIFNFELWLNRNFATFIKYKCPIFDERMYIFLISGLVWDQLRPKYFEFTFQRILAGQLQFVSGRVKMETGNGMNEWIASLCLLQNKEKMKDWKSMKSTESLALRVRSKGRLPKKNSKRSDIVTKGR